MTREAEPVIAVVIIGVASLLFVVLPHPDEARSFFWSVGFRVVLVALALYSLIRFIRWAWETPMPFLK